MKRLLLALMLLAAPAAAQIGDTTYRLTDPVQEQRARAIGQELRCLVCQNQSIDDSDAPLARDYTRLPYSKIRRPIWPLDPAADTRPGLIF